MLKSRQLDAIGEEITACRVQCEGTINEPKEGIYPRGFFPDVDNKESPHFDAVVIGLNPGTASHLEMTFTKYVQEREGCMKYCHIKTVLKPIVKSHPYYTRVRAFLRKHLPTKDLNILWTELVKCQSATKNGKKLPLKFSTKKRCFKRFLKEESEIFSGNRKPLLVFLGNEVMDFIKDHRIHFIGFTYLPLYHPTGGGGARFFGYFRNKDVDNELEKERFVLKQGEKGFRITDASRIYYAKDLIKHP